ncbi:response regulator transcription factor [Streptomyces radiopugnans]|uniref:response regulator transcription factor n=1 Tax=Streptomyces radiopugnans TaxID=403935 RepID=UPI003F19F260
MSAAARLVTRTAGLRVHVVAARRGPAPARLTAMLHQAGVALAPPTEASARDTVVVVVAATVEGALAAAPPTSHRLLTVCDTVSPTALRRAIGAGVLAVLRSADLTPDQLLAAVHDAHHGIGRIPYTALVQLLGGADGQRRGGAPPAPPALTARQTAVLGLMAEGHGNAVIARKLSCSEHTVKNVIYELMARLQVRNRAHAVAHAVRHGLV